jgi:hypothetical protein
VKAAGELITDLVNSKAIEEVEEGLVSDRSSLIRDQMAVSIAISLKRIADALTGGGDVVARLMVQIEQTAWEAGRAFERGRGAV